MIKLPIVFVLYYCVKKTKSHIKRKLLSFILLKVTTDPNNHNFCMIENILPYNCNICYQIYLKLTEINGIGMGDALMMN